MILHIPYDIWQRLKYYVQFSLPNEVTGIGAIRLDDKENCTVSGIFLPHQQVSPGFSEFADGALNTIITDFVGDNPTRVGELCFRWHSHGLGKVFWSGTDEQDISEWKGSWVINLVINARHDVLARLDIFEPFHHANIPITAVIDYPEDLALMAECQSMVKQKVNLIPTKIPGGMKNERLLGSDKDFQ